jgi:hypothetical protein
VQKFGAKGRITLWIAGTGVASVLPVVCITLATLFVESKTLTWYEICSHGDFLIIGAVLSIGGSVELLRVCLDREIADKQKALAAGLGVGGLFLLIAQLLLYILVLSRTLRYEERLLDPRNDLAREVEAGQGGVDPSFWIDFATTVVSPISLVLAILYGAAVVKLSIGGDSQ